jgi:hypothetical protein
MPEWMEDYRAFLPDGDRAEEFMNSKATTFENAPMALLCCQMKGAIYTLTKVYEAGLLSC